VALGDVHDIAISLSTELTDKVKLFSTSFTSFYVSDLGYKRSALQFNLTENRNMELKECENARKGNFLSVSFWDAVGWAPTDSPESKSY
jgi:hypothetical protein